MYPMDRGGNMMERCGTRDAAARSTVIARLDRAIQYAETAMRCEEAEAYWMPRLPPTLKLRRPWTSAPAKPWR